MISERDLQEAIAECQGRRNPDASTCIKLAAFLTIQRELFGKTEQLSFSYAAPAIPADIPVIDAPGDSEFLRVIDGRRQDEVIPILDELMTTIQALNPRLYDAVISKLE